MDKGDLIDLMSIEWSHMEVVVASQVDDRGIVQYRRHSPEAQSWNRFNVVAFFAQYVKSATHIWVYVSNRSLIDKDLKR